MDFNTIINSVVEVVKGIEWDKVIATVKDIVEKAIPVIEKLVQFIADNVG